MTIRLVAEARHPHSGMTLAEVAEFVERARATGCADTDAVQGRVTMRGRVKSLGLAQPDGSAGLTR